MKPFLNSGTNCLELNALFIQPTRWCALSCENCYVREHQGGEDDYHIDWHAWDELFRLIFTDNDKIYTNQLSISIDDLPVHNARARDVMTGVFCSAIYNKIQAFGDGRRTELHLTVNSSHTLLPYFNIMMKKYSIDSVHYIDMLSLSNIKESDFFPLQGLKSMTDGKLQLNYNHLPPKNISSKNINQHVKKIQAIGENVDHIYMLITKSPMGRERNKISQVADSERLRSDIAYINTIRERVSPDVRQKITIDGCLQDANQFVKTGFGCSSNVSRFQVWPDGSVTGCPYAFRGGPKRASTAYHILENIRSARQSYDFRNICTLPTDYSLRRRRKNQSSQIQNRRQVLPVIN